jgi:uncharacterized protein (DUF302 family)
MSRVLSKSYAMEVVLPLPFERALAKVKAALKTQGFGTLTEVDVQATLKEKLGLEFRPYAILGACNPALSSRALAAELEAGLVLPCNVVVYEEGDSTRVLIADPVTMMAPLERPALDEVAREAKVRLQSALAELTG